MKVLGKRKKDSKIYIKLNIIIFKFKSTNCSLNQVKFGDYACEVKACTSNSITCQTKSAYTVYEIENSGRDRVYGYGYGWNYPVQTVKQGDYVKWNWIAPQAVVGVSFKVEQVDSPTSVNASGFTSGTPSAYGSFIYQFNTLGTFYYWTGYVDLAQSISFRGTVVVEANTDKDLDVDVSLNGIKAQKCAFPFTYNSNSYSSCTNVDQSYNWCSPTNVSNGQILKCDPISKNKLYLFRIFNWGNVGETKFCI